MGSKAYVVVEGHGEVQAVQNLLSRLTKDIGFFLPWSTPMRWTNLHKWEPRRTGGVRKAAEFIRNKQDASALLILRDEDDACPKDVAPRTSSKLAELRLPFPTAYVLLHPEYEVLFLPCLASMIGQLPDGRFGLTEGTQWDGDSWEARRGIKEWLSKRFPKGRSYKPTVDQLAMTQLIDIARLRRAEVPSFATLERALQFLCTTPEAGAVYPPSFLP